ncbi:hypothetical protein ACHAWF_016564 [Thalassiosira exigua]
MPETASKRNRRGRLGSDPMPTLNKCTNSPSRSWRLRALAWTTLALAGASTVVRAHTLRGSGGNAVVGAKAIADASWTADGSSDPGKDGYLTCHVLDTANGAPASGMRVELYRIEEGGSNNPPRRMPLNSFVTNADGRLDGPALSGTDFRAGRYEWVFHVGEYFARNPSSRVASVPFLDEVPVRFGVDDSTEHYHVPLLVSPWSYSTYRGS